MYANDLYQKTMTYLRRQTLQAMKRVPHEVVLDQYDIFRGRLEEAVRLMRNPFQPIANSLEDFVSLSVATLPPGELKPSQRLVFTALSPRGAIEPDIWQKKLPGFEMHQPVSISENAEEHNRNLLARLVEVASWKRSEYRTPEALMRYVLRILQREMGRRPQKTVRYLMLNNGSFASLARARYTSEETILNKLKWKDVEALVKDPKYRVGLYELRAWSKLLGVNLWIIGRKHPEKFINGAMCFPVETSPLWLILHMERVQTRATAYETYRWIVRGSDGSYIFDPTDIPPKTQAEMENICQYSNVPLL